MSDDRDDIERMFGPPLPGDPDYEPFDPAKNREALAALARYREQGPRYTAHFTPEAWVNDQAIETDPEGPQEWDCTEYARQYPDYLARLAADPDWDNWPDGATDNDDLFRNDPAAPEWVRAHRGPFTIRIRETGED